MKLVKALLVFAGLPSLSLQIQGHNKTALNNLARDVFRVSSIREIKDAQRQFAQLAQFGRWSDMSALFSDNGTLQWGNETATGPRAIEQWLREDAGDMDGINSGSLDTLVVESPLVSLSVDGHTAKARWNGLRFQGDGKGGTRIQGGIYENEYIYIADEEAWRISLLHYYPLYAGPYIGGWRNVGGKLPIVPYHFTPSDTGIPVPEPVGTAPGTDATLEELAGKIARMNDEDQVRNLQHAYGYYVDRRMWTDVVELFVSDSTVAIQGVGEYNGTEGIRQAMEKMGPEGLTEGILNDHPIFSTIVEIDPDGEGAVARGIDIGMIGNIGAHTALWEFNVFRNKFVKDNGLWKMKELNISPLVVANYSTGWGYGGIRPRNDNVVPAFIDRSAKKPGALRLNAVAKNLTELRRSLARAAAYDGAENESAAYGYYLDDLQCENMGAIHARKGTKASPFAGWFQTPERITEACQVVYGRNHTNPLRSEISFHWRPQPVILVSQDGRSATFRARLLQPSTSESKAGSFNGAMYHDQMVLEDGRWKLWDVTIDEFYWESSSWVGGWLVTNATTPSVSSLLTKYPPDVSLANVGDREAGFVGGRGSVVSWPKIQRMWFEYRNPVSGRIPEHYWPGCVPCQFKSEWKLSANGYLEPPDGPVLSNTTLN